MPPTVLNLLRTCFQTPLTNDSVGAIWKLNKKVRGEFSFVVPRKDFAKFADMKPEDGGLLTVGQYMFFYMYTTRGKCKEPGPDYERVQYYFWDNSSLFRMKGWVPTLADEKTLLTNLNKKIQNLRSNERMPVYVKDKNISEDDITTTTGNARPDVGSQSRSESKLVPLVVNAGPPRVKSTYNWGVINTWSRHMAPESEDHDPVYIYDRFRQATLPSSSNISPLAMLDRDIEDAIEGRSINYEQMSRSNSSTGMVVSTSDTRDRRVRPRAARGQRTRPMISQYR